MLLALLALLLVALVLAMPAIIRGVGRVRRRLAERPGRAGRELVDVPDPGRERRAEQRARELLRSCVNEEEWSMYRDLGFIRVWGTQGRRPVSHAAHGPGVEEEEAGARRAAARGVDALSPRGAADPPSYAYLIYPHKPLVAYVPETQQLLSEYCVEFPELAASLSLSRLPDSDDVLAKWMALTGDERRLIASANLHLPGRQLDPARVRRDIWRLAEWERQRRGRGRVASRG
jgi:hypothetical protein